MLRILQTADWHLGSFNGPTVNGENSRFLDICRCLDALVMEAKKRQPDIIVIAGDVLHQARVWGDRALKESQTAIEYIRNLKKVAPVIVVRGTPNHDSIESFNMLKTAFDGDGNVKVITKPQVAKIFTGAYGWVQIACLPGFDRGYFRAKMPGLDKIEENEIFTQYIDTLIKGLKAQCEENVPCILVTHYTVDGANMESGQTAFFSQFEPCVYLPTLQAADFDLSLFGHIHRPQQIEGCKNAFYCGAVSQLNFNDEGQERGFYIHDLAEDGTVDSEFVKLPTVEFKTFRLEDKQIADFNDEHIFPAPSSEYAGKIVRVLYNCTDEHNKALNKTLMEQSLYAEGAYWVQEITPQKIEITVNRNTLNENDTPENNLKMYLDEHGIEGADAGRVMERAIPIIHEALEKSLTIKTTGAFIPMKIEVKNYRNYRDEKFSFDGIRFCTINGENGAGKSSLFMDAMCDCLFEETREGDISGWISNAEDARSGSIKFTFHMGGATYRVTRTRMKSGKATLNLSELVDGEWTDRSCEKMKDTQQAILNTIGMDSLTLKATALIMQDQYGLFLTADKDARMTILGNILGLGMYDDMYSRAFQAATDVNREIRSLNDKTAILLDGIRDNEEINQEIIDTQEAIDSLTLDKSKADEKAAAIQLALSVMDDAVKRIVNVNSQLATVQGKLTSAENSITSQNLIAAEAQRIVEKTEEIKQGVALYKEAQEQEKDLLEAKAKTEHLTERLMEISKEQESSINLLEATENKRQTVIDTRLIPAKELLNRESELSQIHAKYIENRENLAEMEAKRAEYNTAMEKVREAQTAAEKIQRNGEAGVNERNIRIANLRSKAKLLDKNNCPYAAEVQCSFLKDALEAKGQIDISVDELNKYQEEVKAAAETAEAVLQEAKAAVPSDYSPEKEATLRSVLRGLEVSEKSYSELAVARKEVENAETTIDEYDTEIKAQQERIAELSESIKELEKQRDDLSDQMTEYNYVQERLKTLAHYLEDEKQLPVAEERLKQAGTRIQELYFSISEYKQNIAELAKERTELQSKIAGRDVLINQYEDAKAEAARIDKSIAEYNRKLGELDRVTAETKAKREQAAELTKMVEAKSQEAADLETLKQAFSQDGIPHNIVRSIIPILEATATNILGQMSGGKMSVEFVMEKTLKSNSKKEVTALDVIINDSVTGRLPYLSRSGGEKVKSALAVILALAEIKQTKAGVQMGFLFIDEPAFLDEKGTQAYCDALEAIQSRYSSLKVMAITHDPSFKARFPQSITVYKDDSGSHVRYDQ